MDRRDSGEAVPASEEMSRIRYPCAANLAL
jgi:hypothetical protein